MKTALLFQRSAVLHIFALYLTRCQTFVLKCSSNRYNRRKRYLRVVCCDEGREKHVHSQGR